MENQEVDVLVLSALGVEYNAVRGHLTELQEIFHPAGTVYERGLFSHSWNVVIGEIGRGNVKTLSRTWKVAIGEIGRGNVKAAIETERAIAFLKPKTVFLIGVAGGINKDDTDVLTEDTVMTDKISIGDVVVADKVYDYESGKAEDNKFRSRPGVQNSDDNLVSRAKKEMKRKDWMKRIYPETKEEPKVFVGPIASGEQVIISYNSEVYNLIEENFSDTLAVETEGYGFLTAIHMNRCVRSIVIRGISDLIANKRGSKNQEKASSHAAAFAFEILAKLCQKVNPNLIVS